MRVFSLFQLIGEGLTRGVSLFLTGRHGFVEEVSIPRLDGYRRR